jgi:AraC-like DNA-binding protein/mannose-6-phosphate isomerase-like protein (cupin superfamily)
VAGLYRLTTKYLTEHTQLSATIKTAPVATMHWHEFYELELVLSGQGCCILNGNTYEMKRGSIFFLTPIDFHSVTTSGIEPMEIINIMFSEQWLEDSIFAALLTIDKRMTQICDDACLDRIIALCDIVINEHSGTKPLCMAYAARALECVIIELIRLLGGNEAHITDLDPIRRALIYTQMHFREAIMLAEVAEVACLSRNYFSSKFHASLGITYKEHLIQTRLSYAALLLAHSELSVTQVCFACGFNNFPNFLRAFKKHYGVSPSRYVKMLLLT